VNISRDITEITNDIQSWLDTVFPDRHPDVVISKLMDELEEWKDRPTDAWEMADILIIILDLCHIYGIDPAKAIYWKMDRNRRRQWRFIDGKLQHVEED